MATRVLSIRVEIDADYPESMLEDGIAEGLDNIKANEGVELSYRMAQGEHPRQFDDLVRELIMSAPPGSPSLDAARRAFINLIPFYEEWKITEEEMQELLLDWSDNGNVPDFQEYEER